MADTEGAPVSEIMIPFQLELSLEELRFIRRAINVYGGVAGLVMGDEILVKLDEVIARVERWAPKPSKPPKRRTRAPKKRSRP
jgi:hypothetical protein